MMTGAAGEGEEGRRKKMHRDSDWGRTWVHMVVMLQLWDSSCFRRLNGAAADHAWHVLPRLTELEACCMFSLCDLSLSRARGLTASRPLQFWSMNLENRPLVTDEPVEVEFEKQPVGVEDFERLTDHLRGICGIFYHLSKNTWKMVNMWPVGLENTKDLDWFCPKVSSYTRYIIQLSLNVGWGLE